ncbi:MAG: hypothetical protein LBU97_04595 [Alistipes sp.]|jgi:hypothetical protein|nr:hypothetical protein [Alistipes sp.]
MKMPLLPFVALCLVASTAHAQRGAWSRAQERFIAEQNFYEPSTTQTTRTVSLSLPLGLFVQYAHEHPLGALSTVVGRVGLEGAGGWGTSYYGGNRGRWAVLPSLEVEPRFYYGLPRRDSHGRSAEGNSGSFLALQVKNVLPTGFVSDGAKIRGGTSLTPLWGMRRVWSDHWMFELTFGYTSAWGWGGDFHNSPHFGARFGYAF